MVLWVSDGLYPHFRLHPGRRARTQAGRAAARPRHRSRDRGGDARAPRRRRRLSLRDPQASSPATAANTGWTSRSSRSTTTPGGSKNSWRWNSTSPTASAKEQARCARPRSSSIRWWRTFRPWCSSRTPGTCATSASTAPPSRSLGYAALRLRRQERPGLFSAADKARALYRPGPRRPRRQPTGTHRWRSRATTEFSTADGTEAHPAHPQAADPRHERHAALPAGHLGGRHRAARRSRRLYARPP